jgi:hypothetical protein
MNDKVIRINTFSGRNIYVRTSEQKWLELTAGKEVCNNTITGWALDQEKIEKIITGACPDDFKILAIRPHRGYLESQGFEYVLSTPPADYWVVYSNNDMPTQIQGDFR